MTALAITRRTPRIIPEPQIPAGWRETHLPTYWEWQSSDGTVRVLLRVDSAHALGYPHVVSAGGAAPGVIAARGLRQACRAQEALLDYLAKRAEWEGQR